MCSGGIFERCRECYLGIDRILLNPCAFSRQYAETCNPTYTPRYTKLCRECQGKKDAAERRAAEREEAERQEAERQRQAWVEAQTDAHMERWRDWHLTAYGIRPTSQDPEDRDQRDGYLKRYDAQSRGTRRR